PPHPRELGRAPLPRPALFHLVRKPDTRRRGRELVVASPAPYLWLRPTASLSHQNSLRKPSSCCPGRKSDSATTPLRSRCGGACPSPRPTDEACLGPPRPGTCRPART